MKRTRSKKRSRSRSRSKCKKYLQAKIGINVNEFHKGRFVSKNQAIAVSYSQVSRKHPACKRFLSKNK